MIHRIPRQEIAGAARLTIAVLLFACVRPEPRAASAMTDPTWSFTAGSDIADFKVTPLGSLIVRSEDGVTAIDQATGRTIWARTDIIRPKDALLDFLPVSTLAAIEHPGSLPLLEIIDLETGATRWTSAEVKMGACRGVIFAPHRQTLLVFVAPPHNGKSDPRAPVPTDVMAVNLETGELRWSAPGLLDEDPAAGIQHSREMILAGLQPPIFDTDSTVILYVSRDGVMKLNLLNGSAMWRTRLDARLLPAPAWGFAPMTLNAGVVYVPSIRTLHALSADDGHAVWDSARVSPGRIARIRMTPRGLLVQGSGSTVAIEAQMKPGGMVPARLSGLPPATEPAPGTLGIPGTVPPAAVPANSEREKARRQDWAERSDAFSGHGFLDLLDPATGGSRWPRALEVDEGTLPYAARGDTAFLLKRNRLEAVDLATGSAHRFGQFKFLGGDDPILLEVEDAGRILALSPQGAGAIDGNGTLEHQVFYQNPGPGGLAALGFVTSLAMTVALATMSAAASTEWGFVRWFGPWPTHAGEPVVLPAYVPRAVHARYEMARTTPSFNYIFTEAKDVNHKTGPGIVKIEVATGRVAGQVVLGDHTPVIELDPVESRLYFRASNRRLVCFHM